jgi:uncharacterized repeat protein (TIGR03803 family)
MKPVARLALAALMLALSTSPLNAQSFGVLHIFPISSQGDSANPYAGLTPGGNMLYGVTERGGVYDSGMVFAMPKDGSGFTVLHDFSGSYSFGPDGAFPYGGMALAGNTLYGTTSGGGGSNIAAGGIVFSITTNGNNYTILHNFSVADGQFPHGRLVLSGNTLYGTTLGAGSTGWGSIFSMTTDGSNFNVLHTFSTPVSNGSFLTNSDGEQPWAGVVLSSNILYGTCYGGGRSGFGTVYSVGTNGLNFTMLHAFTNSPEGAFAQGGLTISGNILYGTTEKGGTNDSGTIYLMKLDGCDYHVMHSFQTNGIEGRVSWAAMALSGNRLYGTTQSGGAYNKGTVFSMSTYFGFFSVLHDFDNTNGAGPVSDLILSGNTAYGTTLGGGSSGYGGTVFSQPLPAPYITSIGMSGADLNLAGTNGLFGQTYHLLMSSDLALPFSQWTSVATNLLNTEGDFTITATNVADPVAPQRFYILQLQ